MSLDTCMLDPLIRDSREGFTRIHLCSFYFLSVYYCICYGAFHLSSRVFLHRIPGFPTNIQAMHRSFLVLNPMSLSVPLITVILL